MNAEIDFEAIKASHTIEAVLEKRGVKLQRAAGGWACACPIHQEKKGTSFSVNTRKQLWNCFGQCSLLNVR